jgi:D-alanyl-D-alanine carboxypeptidase
MNEDEVRPKLEQLFRQVSRRKTIGHAVMAVESGDGAFRWSAAAGDADGNGREMKPDTPFFIASIDKLLNATIAAILAARGRLDLDAPVIACLPEALTRGLHRWKGEDLTASITVRHLLTHASGLPDWLEDRPARSVSLADRVVRDGDLALDLDGILDIVRQLRPKFPPQNLAARRLTIRYSDTNFILLSAIIEAVCRRPLPEIHEELLYRPLGMQQSWFDGRSEPLAPAPAPAVLYADGRPLPIPLLMRSFHGIYSTASDLIAFMRGVVRGDAFGGPAPLEAMQERWNRFGLPRDRAALRAPGWPIEYGLGIKRFQLPRLFNGFRRMPPVIGHTGSTGSWLFHCPERDLYFAGSVDDVSAGAVPYRVVPKMLRMFDRSDRSMRR